MPELKKVSWNASAGLIAEISNRRSYANNFFVNGNIRKAFDTLITIRQSVVQSLAPEERNRLRKYEQSFNNISFGLSRNASMSFNKDTRKSFNEIKTIAIKIYFKYNDELMDLLDKYGYLISEQTDASKMKF